MNLTDKYRPCTLADIIGQPWTVHQLQTFVESPVPTAFLFEGETGTGKSSAALALAADLGVDCNAGPLGGLVQIASGEQTGETVRRVMDGLRLFTLSGSGWKVLVVNEADCMTPNAAYIWLDALERIPPRSVIVFTTNHADKIPARLRDRCERFRFESGYVALAPYLPELIARVWKGETGRDDPPDLDALGPLQDVNANVSVRRVIQAMAPLIREEMTVGFSRDVRLVHARQVNASTVEVNVRAKARANRTGGLGETLLGLLSDGPKARRELVAALGTPNMGSTLARLIKTGRVRADGGKFAKGQGESRWNGAIEVTIVRPTDFDAAAVWAKRQAGATWKALASELKLPETTVRGRLYRAGFMRKGERKCAV